VGGGAGGGGGSGTGLRAFDPSFIVINMTQTVLSIVAVVLVAALIWLQQRQMRVVVRTIRPPQPRDIPTEVDLEPLWKSIEGLEKRTLDSLRELTSAVAHGIEHVDRNEKRVRGIVTGAIRRFENSDHFDAAVDAEADSLPPADGGGRSQEELQLVPEDLEVVEPEHTAWDSVPGFKGVD